MPRSARFITLSARRNAGALTLLLLASGLALAQSGGDFRVQRSTLGAGTAMQGGAFRVEASLAQVDATPIAIGGDFALAGGYWPSAAARADALFADGFEP